MRGPRYSVRSGVLFRVVEGCTRLTFPFLPLRSSAGEEGDRGEDEGLVTFASVGSNKVARQKARGQASQDLERKRSADKTAGSSHGESTFEQSREHHADNPRPMHERIDFYHLQIGLRKPPRQSARVARRANKVWDET